MSDPATPARTLLQLVGVAIPPARLGTAAFVLIDA
jgi:hypothetical protein